MDVKTVCAAALLAAVATSPALSQTTAPPPAGSKQVIPEKRSDAIQSGRSESLSGKLSETNGVIKPKTNVDPGMRTPAPDSTPHSMPVIPPSATEGGTAK